MAATLALCELPIVNIKPTESGGVKGTLVEWSATQVLTRRHESFGGRSTRRPSCARANTRCGSTRREHMVSPPLL